ncbi:MAG TPA: DinB family protein [Candidatus Limnocylindrales bacterium]
MSIRAFYDRWPQYNDRLSRQIASLTPEQLAFRPESGHWPIWAIVGHVAGTRVYWLCHVLRERGMEKTPFGDPELGWEDDLTTPRDADELVDALGSTFAIVEAALDGWTPEMLGAEFRRDFGDEHQVHTRASILQRLLTHEAYHDGEISLILGLHGIEAIDLWHQLR